MPVAFNRKGRKSLQNVLINCV